MSENFKIGNFTCATKEIYETLKSENLSASTVAKIDKNSDNKISEDELVEFQDEEETKTLQESSIKTEADLLQDEYNRKMNELFELQNKLIKSMEKHSSLLKQESRLSDNSEQKEAIREKIQSTKSKIDSLNNSINQCLNNLSEIMTSIIQARSNIAGNETAQNMQVSYSVAPIEGGTVAAPVSSEWTGSKETTTIPSNVAQKLDAKLGKGFSAKCESVAKEVGCNPNDLLAMMYSESGLNPSTKNSSGGATGLFQFMPSTLASYGYTSAQVANMSAIQQLDLGKDMILKAKAMCGYSKNDKLDAGTLYAINFLPAVAKKDVLCTTSDKLSWAYRSNSALDLDKNGDISKQDLAKRLSMKYSEMIKNI